MADTQLKQLLDACARYHRDVAFAHIDVPPGEVRAARVAEAVQRGVEVCLSSSDLQTLQSAIAEAPPASQAELLRLRAWGLETHLRGALTPHQQEIQARQRSATCLVDEEAIPLLASFPAMARETRRDRRAAIATATGEQLEDINPYFEEQYKEMCRVAESLGYESLAAWWMAILPVEPASQQAEVVRLLQETQDVYTDLLSWAVRQRLGVPPGQLQRHDILALFTFPDYQQYYQPDTLTTALERNLQDMGVDPHADGRIELRQCPAAFGPPAAVAVNIPDEIVLTYRHVSGLKVAEAYASAYGRALLWGYTSPELPLVVRLLGDAALPLSNGQFLAELIALPGWLRHYLGLTVDRNYRLWRRLDRLYCLRRQLGRFLYAQYIVTSDSLAGASEAYREIMMDACLVDHSPAYYLVDWDWSYASLAFLRGWKLAHVLLDTARQQFGIDWFRVPDSGAWLKEYWHDALGEPLDALLQNVAGVVWDATLFAEVLTHEEAW
ncbi:hypothetical protein NKDENANG_01307 [Candidatus Entotheonellaceae bacterium PAL068K]